jgi:hypothetical protein
VKHAKMTTETSTEVGVNSRRNVFALGFASFFNDVFSEMVFSLLPTFLLGLPGGSVAILEFVEGFAEALSYALRSVSGILSDKLGKKETARLSRIRRVKRCQASFRHSQSTIRCFGNQGF